jgi:alpha-L-glutamate ligase-like protein
MNERVFSYQSLNAGKYPIADNKLKTKRVLKDSGIPMPAVVAVIRNRQELEDFDFESLPKSFVLKPARGFKGAGINIYYNRSKDGRWILADRSKHSVSDIKQHIQDILDGQYSLSLDPKPSVALIEERVRMSKEFKYYSYRGIPDIRVIVYNKVPVMAMLRLPTKESEGKANISREAIGVGIDMARGVTTTAIKNGRVIETLPGTQVHLSGIRIPYWNKILRLSSECQTATGLGYIGVDIIIDKEKGPLVVELNARPGLAIQVANQTGLKERLERVRRLKIKTTERAVRLAKDLFGGEIEEEIETLSGREVIGLEEEIILSGKDGKERKVHCKIDTGAESS